MAYDRLSRWYDWLAGSEETFNRRGVEMLELAQGERLLEIGFGTGKTLAGLPLLGLKAAGVDLSFGMARTARARLRKMGLESRILLNLGDAVRLPFPPGCFDAVFTGFTLELFDTPEIPCVLDEIHRVLREDGRLGIVSLSLPEQPGYMLRVYEWFHRTLPAYVDCRPIPVAALQKQNGFQVCKIECRMMWGLPVEIVMARPSRKIGCVSPIFAV
jgi:ubiquinone/menaquinone biosynthesis C-methylase UbiE